MNHIRLVTIGGILVFALTGFAGQSFGGETSSGKTQHESSASSSAPDVEEHLKMLATRLDLTSDQQTRIKPALAEMMETMRALENDQSISSEQRTERMTAAHQKADRKAREVLNEEQKKKLDQLESEAQ